MADTNGFNYVLQDCNVEAKVVDKLLQRSEARLLEMEKKKSEKENKSTIKEQANYFNSVFNQYKKEITFKLLSLQNTEKALLNNHLDEISKDFQKLQKLLSDYTMFLPTYDIKISQESLKHLQEEINKAENSLLPKKKFAFRSKGRVQKVLVSEISDSANNSILKVSELSDCDIRNLSGETVEMHGTDIDKKDVGLHSLHSCKIFLYGTPSTIFINGLMGCEIYSGPVSTSILIENCVDCSFLIACQQLRVHNSSKCTFQLHVTSRTIIEDCSFFQFSPYLWTYPNQDTDFANSGLDKNMNNWNKVDDFNWLVSGVPSPNWSLLGEDTPRTVEDI